MPCGAAKKQKQTNKKTVGRGDGKRENWEERIFLSFPPSRAFVPCGGLPTFAPTYIPELEARDGGVGVVKKPEPQARGS